VDRTVGIHRVGRSGVQITHRVVGDGCKVDNSVDADKLIGANVADVASVLLVRRRLWLEIAAVIPARVKPDDIVTGLPQERDDHRAEIAAVARHENTHWPPARWIISTGPPQYQVARVEGNRYVRIRRPWVRISQGVATLTGRHMIVKPQRSAV
jgi:hypothetical protein